MTTCLRNLSIAVIVTLTAVFSVNSSRAAGAVKGVNLDLIHLPPGFEISLYAENVPTLIGKKKLLP